MDTPAAAPQPPQTDQTRWFTEEVYRHDGQLKAWLRGRFPGAREQVDDVVQESYLRIWKVRTGREITSAKAFLFQIAHNFTLNLLRQRKRADLVEGGEEALSGVIDDRPDAALCLTNREKIELLTDALATLPDRTRAIVLLNKFEGITQAEVAIRLGISVQAVERHISRGVSQCTSFVRAQGYDIS